MQELIDQRLQLKMTKKCILAQFKERSVYLDRVKASSKVRWDNSRFDRELVKQRSDWCYRQSCHVFIQFSTCRCWGSSADPSHVLQPQAVELSEDLTYEEYPLAIVDREVRQLRTQDIPMVKVLWCNHTAKDCTLETEEMILVTYPYLFHS